MDDTPRVFWQGKEVPLAAGECGPWHPDYPDGAAPLICRGSFFPCLPRGDPAPGCDDTVLVFTPRNRRLFPAVIHYALDLLDGPGTRHFASDGRPFRVPDRLRPEEAAAFEADPGAWPVYRDWCLEHGWGERAEALGRAIFTGEA